MMVHFERTKSGSRTRGRCALAGFLCMMGIPFLVLVLPEGERGLGVVTRGVSKVARASTDREASPRSSSTARTAGLC